MHPKINLQHIALLQHYILLTRIRREMRGAIIQRQTRREANPRFETPAGFESLVVEERADAVFNFMGDGSEGGSGLNRALRVLADLSVDFGGFAVVVEPLRVLGLETAEVTGFFVGGAEEVVVLVVLLIGEELALRVDA